MTMSYVPLEASRPTVNQLEVKKLLRNPRLIYRSGAWWQADWEIFWILVVFFKKRSTQPGRTFFNQDHK